jgi:hypothetical protein
LPSGNDLMLITEVFRHSQAAKPDTPYLVARRPVWPSRVFDESHREYRKHFPYLRSNPCRLHDEKVKMVMP